MKKETLEELLENALIKEEDRPYEVPGNWVWVRLINGFAECLDRFRKPVNAAERASRNGIVPYYGATGQVGWIDDYLTDEQLVLVGEDGAPFFEYIKDKAYIINGKAWVNNHAHILKSFYGSNGNKYLMHYLNIFDYKGYVNGTTRLKLTQARMNDIPVPLPPLPEQKRIVDVIESLFEKLDKAKELVENALDSFQNRKAAILHKAFTGELTTKWREENGFSLEDWEEKELGDIVTYSKEKYNPSIEASKVIYIGLEHIEKNGGLIDKGTSDEVKSLKTVFKKGDILYGKLRPYLNKHIIVDFDGICSTDILVIRVKSTALNSYINYVLNVSNFIDYAVINSKGINLPRISEKEISKYKLKIPSINEQQQIVRILDNLLEKEEKGKELCDVLEKIELMKKAILARAFRGELGTNNPEEESAVELLREIPALETP